MKLLQMQTDAPPQGSSGRSYLWRTSLRSAGPKMQAGRQHDDVRYHVKQAPQQPLPWSLSSSLPCAAHRHLHKELEALTACSIGVGDNAWAI